MPRRLHHSDPDFRAHLDQLLAASRETLEDVDAAVAAILADVRQRGDTALFEYTQKFDGFDPANRLTVSAVEINQAVAQVPDETLDALKVAYDRIWSFHERQRPEDDSYQDALGVTLGSRWTAVDRVGLYVPGGKAAYPSSVLMNAIPAKVAGVAHITMVAPTPGGVDNALVLAAADLAGVDEIHRIGGAQAIAALSYGTNSIAPVSKIVGPGNAYVAAAKRRVFGQVGIDMIAGPSEVLVIADDSANPAWVAADLLAQAEHDASAQAILVTYSEKLVDEVQQEVTAQLAMLPRAEIAGASWRDHGALIVVKNLEQAAEIANELASEHLELCVANTDDLLPQIRHAGAIFIGHHTPEAIGDYVGGTNHVLPTSRSARYASGLSVLDFMKRTSILGCTKDALMAIGPAAVTLADEESLTAHGRSITARISQPSVAERD